MYYSSQTLRHKGTNALVRLAGEKEGPAFHWNIEDGKSAFIAEDGTHFRDILDNYTHIEDELGRPVAGFDIKQGEFVDSSLRKYLVSPEEKAQMREAKLLAWEAELLAEMRAGGRVLCPFADGSKSQVFQEWFLKRRNAVPLWEEDSGQKWPEWAPVAFQFEGNWWVHTTRTECLIRVKPLTHLQVVGQLCSFPA